MEESNTILDTEAQIESTLDSEVQIESTLSPDVQISSTLENVVEITHEYQGLSTNDIVVTVNNTNHTISATLVPFEWLEFEQADWVQTLSYYKLVIPYATHGCLNAYVDEMLINSPADSGDAEDEAGLENNIPTWKLLANDSIVIKSDEPVDCKILIKGER